MHMTLLDWAIVVFAALVAIVGFDRGLIAAVLTLGGFILGGWLGLKIAPLFLSGGSGSPYASLVGLCSAIFVGIVLAASFHGIGARLNGAIRFSPVGVVDGVLGAAFAFTVALAFAWICAAALLHTPGLTGFQKDLRRSSVITKLNTLLPPPGPVLAAIDSLDPIPRLSGNDQKISVPPPGTPKLPAVQSASRSVVKVTGTACGLIVQGSGWVAAPGRVVTNAHVVAGETDTSVEASDAPGQRLTAQVIGFDVKNDIAVLNVPNLALKPLTIDRTPKNDEAGTIIGYPGNGPLTLSPGRIGQQITVNSQDAYGKGSVSREMVPIRGKIQGGDSGGPVVNSRGDVLTTVFAAFTGTEAAGGYGIPNSIAEADLRSSQGPVSTGACAG